ncbi:DUF3093 domain-containing protein [Zafaria sp. Z1313]|uniref:DUF3093 domain-containing protein n=1 Tax=unclassified Zafaria TaxID=2828765 RepID=UPI002E771FD0|nr:DUF3093 domain-containing protein [Zafaria sp. J156]MEE1620101.1 DUF3093 domain-containing protein [Zafaria sp. J156]
MATTPQQSPTAPAPLFHEKLWPAWWIWLLVLGTGGAAFVALAPVGITAGIVAAIVVVLALIVVGVATTSAITVTEDTLQVGRAVIERSYVGEAAAYRGEDATFQRGRGLNGTAFLCLRGWIDPVARIEITDPRDATPYWLASTRRPEDLVAALQRP